MIQKQYTYEIASSLGIPCPGTLVPKSIEDLRENRHRIVYPCLLKPCEGHKFYDHFEVKMFKIEDEGQLFARYRQVEELELKMMIQELIPGDDSQGANYISYSIDGYPIAEFTSRKLRQEPPFFGVARVVVSKHIPEITEFGRLLLREMNYQGQSGMEFKRDVRDGVYKLMEVNCRNNLSGLLAVRCGINFPWIMYQHLLCGQIHHGSEFEQGIYWINLDPDIMRFFVSRKEEGFTFMDYIRPYLGEKVFALTSLSDPLPCLARYWYIGRETIRKISGVVRKRGKKPF